MTALIDARIEATVDPDTRVRRWQVLYESANIWYPVGEFLSIDAAGAIERAIDVFGPGVSYKADEIPWDAAPLHRAR